MDTHAIIKQLTKELSNSPLEEERITELKPIDYVMDYYDSPFLGFEDPRDGKKHIIEWNSDKKRVKELKRINKVIAEDKQLYEKVYFEEYRKRKYKNIMISTGATALIAGAVIFHVLSNLSFGDDYDVYMGP